MPKTWRDKYSGMGRLELERKLHEYEKEGGLMEQTGRLLAEAGEMVQAWESQRELDGGFNGMGHNILTQSASKLKSISSWNRLKNSVDKMRELWPDVE